MSSSTQVSSTTPIRQSQRHIEKNNNGQSEIRHQGWVTETITLKFGSKEKPFFTARSKLFEVNNRSSSIQLFQNEQNPDVIQYAKTNKEFIQKLRDVAGDLGFDLQFGRAKGDGDCLYHSLAKQLEDLDPKLSYMDIKRKVLETLFADETLLPNLKFDSGDGENFHDLVKLLENLWDECKKKKVTKQPITTVDEPLEIVSDAVQQPSSKPKNPFRLLKAVIACVFGNERSGAMTKFVKSMTNVCIHISYLYPCQMLALTNLISFSFFFKAIDEYEYLKYEYLKFSLAVPTGLTLEEAIKLKETRDASETRITTSLNSLRAVETKILRNCLLATQRETFLGRILITGNLNKIVNDCAIDLPVNACLLAPLVEDWNGLIKSIGMRLTGADGIDTYAPVNPDSVNNTLESLQQCFALRTETQVLLLLNLRSSNYSGELHLNAAARAFNRPIHVYSNLFKKGGLPQIYGSNDTDAAGNYFVVSFS